MSPLTRVSVAVYDSATALTAVVVVLANGISLPVGWVLIFFGLIVDLNRFTSTRFPDGVTFQWGRLCLPVQVYLRPISTLYLMGGAIFALVLLYYAIPDVCWPAFNEWVETNVSIVNWRLHGFPGACDIPHGAVLLVAQSWVPVITVLGVAIPVTSARFEPVRFLEDLERDTHGHLRRGGKQPKIILLGLAVAVVWIYIVLVGLISFTPDDPNIVHTKPLSPHSNVFHFVLWCILMFFPQTFFIHLSAGGRAGLQIR